LHQQFGLASIGFPGTEGEQAAIGHPVDEQVVVGWDL